MSRITHLQSGKAKPAARLERDRETKAMDAIVTKLTTEAPRPTREEAEQAVRTLLLWAGDDPEREGLLDTPARVAKAYGELFSGYSADIEDVLGRTFEEVGGYDDMVLVRDIPFFSHCEHHYAAVHRQGPCRLSAEGPRAWPIQDRAGGRCLRQAPADAGEHDGPDRARDRRDAASRAASPSSIEAEHMCMAMRGVQKQGVSTITTTFTGAVQGPTRPSRPAS